MAQEHVYDPANEVIVLRAAISFAQSEDRQTFRALVHKIGADEFLVAQNCSIWRVLRRLSDGDLEYTADVVRQMLVHEATAVEDGYLEELENTAEVPANFEWHVDTLRWDATRARVMKGALTDLVGDLSDARVTVDRAVSSARSVVRALEGGAGRKYIRRPDEMHSGYRAALRKRREHGNFFPTGFTAVDKRMNEGFMPGNTCIVTGLSGSGKSTFAAKLAINLARLGRKVLVCAWEMGAESTLDLMVSSLTQIPLSTVIKGIYSDDELSRLDKAAAWVAKRIRFMENAFFQEVSVNNKDRRFSNPNQRNQDILEGYIAESGCDEVIMDLFDRLLADQSPDAVTQALYRQQAMHKEYSVHGTLLVQLRLKDVEKRPDKRPTRESIKGVGTYVEVADLIFGCHRDAQFKAVPDNTLELICLKQRKGELNWAVRFDWDGATCKIEGGVEVPYNPGLDSTTEFGEMADPGGIQARPKPRSRMKFRD